jgi:Chitobiase/beta-hexosaminidase C-terminal domain
MQQHSRRIPSAAPVVQRAWPPGMSRRSAMYLTVLFGALLASLFAVAGSARAAVTVGSNITAFPNRDMAVVVGYEPDEELTVDVLRNGVVIGTTKGPAVETPEGIGLEVNHGPLGAPAPGDCWENYTPDIIGGDVIRVTTARGVDTMTVAGVDMTGDPVLVEGTDSVAVKGTASGLPLTDIAVEFRRDKPQPRFRRGPFLPVATATAGEWEATFRPSTTTSPEGLSTAQQRDIALNEASWSAVVDNVTETTISELGEPGGVAAGCTGSADPNAIGGGYTEPVNLASGDITLSGTARDTVTAVSVKVGALAAKDATLSETATGGVKTWTLALTKAELEPLPDGSVTIIPSFDTIAGGTRSMLKDTVAPELPTATPLPGTYTSAQNVTLRRAAAENPLSKVHYEIGGAAVPDPDASSFAYTTQIAVSATQTIKARVIDPAGNPGPVAEFVYRIGTPPPPPTSLNVTEGAKSAKLTWTAAGGATGYNVYRDGGTTAVNATPTAATSYTDGNLAEGQHSYTVKSVDGNGFESTTGATGSFTLAAPGTPGGLTANAGNAQVGLSWTRNTDADLAGYIIKRNGTELVRIAESQAAFTDTGLTNGTPYTYTIAAADDAGNVSADSAAVQATPEQPADTTPPPAPTVNPASATYTSAQSVTMSSSEAGAVIRYTVGQGTAVPVDPTGASTQYTAAMPVGSSQVIKAAAFDAAGNRSAITQRNYTINTATTPPPATRTFVRGVNFNGGAVTIDGNAWQGHRTGALAPNLTQNGTFFANQAVTLNPATDATRASMIRSSTFSRTLSINLTSVTAGNYEVGVYVWEDNATQTYTLNVEGAAQTVVSGAAGRWQKLTFNRPVSDGTITITTSGGDANVSGIEVFRTATGTTTPPPADTTPPPAPSVNPATGTYTSAQSMTASNTEAGVTTRYTVGNGTTVPADPTATSALYSGAVAMDSSRVVKVAAFDAAGNRSPITQRNYTITIATPDTTPPPAPTVNPASGTFTSATSMTASNTEAGVTTRYTVGNGTTVPADPTATSTQYSGAVAVNTSQVVKVAAFDAAGNRSAVTQRNYTINTTTTPPPTATRTFVRGVNFNGGAVTIDGNAWRGHTTAAPAPNLTQNGWLFANQAVTLNPATDATRASMIRSSTFGTALNIGLTGTTAGTYEVGVYVWEDNASETFTLNVEGAGQSVTSGAAGRWQKVTFTRPVSDGTITITTSGGGANLSGIEVFRVS